MLLSVSPCCVAADARCQLTRNRKCKQYLHYFETYLEVPHLHVSINTQCFPHIDFTWAGYPGILTAAQVYLVTHFCFITVIISYTFFLSARDKETIRDRVTKWKISPRPMRFVLLVLCAQELSTLPQTISSVSHTLIICGGPQQYPPPAAISFSMESWRFPATRATISHSGRWRPDGACPATRQSSESLYFMQMKSNFRERQSTGKPRSHYKRHSATRSHLFQWRTGDFRRRERQRAIATFGDRMGRVQ